MPASCTSTPPSRLTPPSCWPPIDTDTTPVTTDSKPRAGRLLTALVLSAFFVSGIAGLLHEVIWIRLLRHVMGNSSFAISMVLTVFMGGLALGSFLAGRMARRLRRPLLAFAAIEACIGLYGLALPHLLNAAQPLYQGMYAAADGSLVVVTLARFGLSALLLLVPATLMGTTMPILAHLFEETGSTGRKVSIGLGTLYAVNTLGAALGAASTGFLWIPTLGMQKTIFLAALLNGLVALAGVLLQKRMGAREPEVSAAQSEQASVAPRGAGSWRLLLFAYGASGFSALTYEVSWTRVLSAQIGSTVYAFSMMLTAFILGLGLGSLVAARWVDRLARPTFTLAVLQAGIALACFLIVPAFEWLPVHLTGVIARASADGFMSLQVTLFGVLLLIMLVPTMLMGASFPLVARLALMQNHGAASAVGTIYSANTVGTILGSALAGFVLIPTLGTQDTMAVGVAINALVAALLFQLSKGMDSESDTGPASNGLAVAALLLGGCVFLLPNWNPGTMSFGPFMEARRNVVGAQDTKILRQAIANETERRGILFHEEGLNTTVTVRKDPMGEISLWVNGKPDASSSRDLPTQVMLAEVPLLLHPDPKSAMLIGLASGITLGSMATHPLERLDCAEISGAVVRASEFFRPYNGDVLDDPRVNILVEDGRNHLAMTDQRYDVIVSEPSNPWIAGVADLFTQEFFQICRARLTERGVVCIWLAGYNLDQRSFRSVVGTFFEVFPGGQVWNAQGTDYLLVGSVAELQVDAAVLAERMAGPQVAADLARVGVRSPTDWFSYFLCGSSQAQALAGDAPMHTDDNALIEFNAPRNMAYNAEETALVEHIEEHRSADLAFLTGSGSEALRSSASNAVQATGLVEVAKLRLNAGRGLGALDAVRQAQVLHPGNPGLKVVFDLSSQLAQRALQAGRTDEGTALLEALVKLDPKRPFEQLMLGNLHFGKNRMRLAAAAYEACITEAPSLAEALYRLAFVLGTAPGDELFNPARALDLARRAVDLTQSKNPVALRSLGVALAALGRPAEAVRAIDDALLAADSPQIRNNPGLIQELQAMRRAFEAGGSWRLGR